MSNQTNERSKLRLALIKKLISLAYLYSDNGRFYRKFTECINITSLKDQGVIEIDRAGEGISLSKKEVELYTLMQNGFTPQEISVILGEKDVNNVYVRQCRLRKKLKGKTTPGVVLGMLLVVLIIYFVLTIA